MFSSGVDRPSSALGRVSPPFNGHWWLCHSFCRTLTCTEREGRRKDSGTPRKPRNGECAALRWGDGEDRLVRTCYGGAPASPRWSPESAPGLRLGPRRRGLRSPPALSQGAGPAAETPGIQSRHCAATWTSGPLWAALRPRPRVSPGGALTARSVIRGQSWPGLRGSCVGAAGVCGVPSSFCLPGGGGSFSWVFQMFGEQGLKSITLFPPHSF